MPESAKIRDNYSIRLRRGESEVEISSPDPEWVQMQLKELARWLSTESQPEPGSEPPGPGKPEGPLKGPSLAEHVRLVEPAGGLEHVLAVGYYLERYSRLQGGFRRRDLVEAFRAIRYQHSNPGVPISAGRRKGLLMDGDEHEKIRLTESADRWVESRLAG
ncbi:MAG TPA: hypothetical protein VHL54_04550 [Actinomycetota bacterium]|nr:hypothetical protein [Actinomycetota bacterium]